MAFFKFFKKLFKTKDTSLKSRAVPSYQNLLSATIREAESAVVEPSSNTNTPPQLPISIIIDEDDGNNNSISYVEELNATLDEVHRKCSQSLVIPTPAIAAEQDPTGSVRKIVQPKIWSFTDQDSREESILANSTFFEPTPDAPQEPSFTEQAQTNVDSNHEGELTFDAPNLVPLPESPQESSNSANFTPSLSFPPTVVVGSDDHTERSSRTYTITARSSDQSSYKTNDSSLVQDVKVKKTLHRYTISNGHSTLSSACSEPAEPKGDADEMHLVAEKDVANANDIVENNIAHENDTINQSETAHENGAFEQSNTESSGEATKQNDIVDQENVVHQVNVIDENNHTNGNNNNDTASIPQTTSIGSTTQQAASSDTQECQKLSIADLGGEPDDGQPGCSQSAVGQATVNQGSPTMPASQLLRSKKEGLAARAVRLRKEVDTLKAEVDHLTKRNAALQKQNNEQEQMLWLSHQREQDAFRKEQELKRNLQMSQQFIGEQTRKLLDLEAWAAEAYHQNQALEDVSKILFNENLNLKRVLANGYFQFRVLVEIIKRQANYFRYGHMFPYEGLIEDGEDVDSIVEEEQPVEQGSPSVSSGEWTDVSDAPDTPTERHPDDEFF